MLFVIKNLFGYLRPYKLLSSLFSSRLHLIYFFILGTSQFPDDH